MNESRILSDGREMPRIVVYRQSPSSAICKRMEARPVEVAPLMLMHVL